MENIKRISLNIYADSDEEAEMGRKAIVSFINMVGQHGAKVSGRKLAEAVGMIATNPFITTQIINFFLKQ